MKKEYQSKAELLDDYTLIASANFNDEQRELFQKYNFAPVTDANGIIYVITIEKNLINKIIKGRITRELKVFETIIQSKDKIIVINEGIFFSIVSQKSLLKKVYTVNDAEDLFMDILTDSSRKEASDIHLIWKREGVLLKYRIDGEVVVQDREIPHKLGEAFKNICINRTGEDEYAQNEISGQFEAIVDGKKKEYRLSIGPTVNGYTIVIRIASSIGRDATLKKWNYSKRAISIINKMKNLKHGIILVTGPTGSGKSTLLYTLANELSLSGNKIIKTVEDPVEIYVDGIDQVSVNVKGDKESWMTFANAIKMFLRQDPDFIIVGEIRDSEVALAAISAAKTGHLTFSTLHTNDVESTISRLYDLNLKNIDIEDGLRGVISQRLIPVLCPRCKIKKELKGRVTYERNKNGCKYCEISSIPGYKGRMPLAEVALLNNKKDNFKRENFEEYLSLEESIIELIEAGIIDEEEASKHINMRIGEDFSLRKEMTAIWNKVIVEKNLNRIYPVYQEIKDKRDFVIGYEVLTRIKDLEDAILMPPKFMPILEQIGISRNVSSYIFKNIISFSKKMTKSLFFNLSELELLDDSYMDYIIKTIKENDLRSKFFLEFDFDAKYLNIIEKLQDNKIQFSLHNFSGNLEDIILMERNHISPAYIKTNIDFSLGIASNEHWLSDYIHLLKKGNTKLIGHYIETAGILEEIKNNYKDIDFYQGFYINSPKKTIVFSS
jgi:type IV pilus assembly protein PilB